MPLPEATADDLRRVGITPEMIRAAFEHRDRKVDGEVSVSVLTDVALLNFDPSRLVISSPTMTGTIAQPAVPRSTRYLIGMSSQNTRRISSRWKIIANHSIT